MSLWNSTHNILSPDYSKLPPVPPVDMVFLLDPLIGMPFGEQIFRASLFTYFTATGGTACAALSMISDWGIPSKSIITLMIQFHFLQNTSWEDQTVVYSWLWGGPETCTSWIPRSWSASHSSLIFLYSDKCSSDLGGRSWSNTHPQGPDLAGIRRHSACMTSKYLTLAHDIVFVNRVIDFSIRARRRMLRRLSSSFCISDFLRSPCCCCMISI